MIVERILLLALTMTVLPATAQQSLESAYRTTGSEVVSVFEEQRQVLQKCSAVIRSGRDETGYGVVVSADGYLLTKASEVMDLEDLSVTVDRKHYKSVEIVAVDPAWDVALLKVDAEGLTPVEFAETSEVAQGTWVVANGATSRTRRRLLPGIISANHREIPPEGGAALGLLLNFSDGVLKVEEVSETGGAKEAGLLAGDVIVSVNGEKVANIKEVGEALVESKAGETVKLRYLREGKEFEIDVRLSTRGEITERQLDRNDMMSGEFSNRRSGFPRVLQHDVLSNAHTVGGPLLDLDGRCLGMNIARANRAESYAIPLEQVKEITRSLMAQVAK